MSSEQGSFHHRRNVDARAINDVGARSLGVLRAIESTLGSFESTADLLGALRKSGREILDDVEREGVPEGVEPRVVDLIESCKNSLISILDNCQKIGASRSAFRPDDGFEDAHGRVVEIATDTYETFSELLEVLMVEASLAEAAVGPFEDPADFIAALRSK